MNKGTCQVARVVNRFEQPHLCLALSQRAPMEAQLIKQLGCHPVAHGDYIHIPESCQYAPGGKHIAQALFGSVDTTKQAASVHAKDRSQTPISSRRSGECLLHRLEAGFVVTTVRACNREPVEDTGWQFWVFARVCAKDVGRLFQVRASVVWPTGAHLRPSQLCEQPTTARAGTPSG
jgi:hypothetical protein